MSQAIVDPAELRRFAQNLKKFNQELEERLTSLRAQLHSLGSTWRDQENKKFVEDFEEHMKVIGRFMEEKLEPIMQLYNDTYHEILENTAHEIVNWSERVIEKSHRVADHHIA